MKDTQHVFVDTGHGDAQCSRCGAINYSSAGELDCPRGDKRRFWKFVWICCILFHIVAGYRMYRLWWFFACRWVYPYMTKAKKEGRHFAQPYGEGMVAVLHYIDKRLA